MKSKINLDQYERHYLDGKFFIVKKGKLVSRDILDSGKIITNENYLKEGDLIGNFFEFLPDNNIILPEIDIEVEALEDGTILEEFEFSADDIFQNIYFEKILMQLIKKSMIKFFYQVYDTKGYIMAILKLYADDEKTIAKKDINYENFNISRSQFYLIYSKLKKEKFIIEKEKKIILNIEKIDEYLSSNYD